MECAKDLSVKVKGKDGVDDLKRILLEDHVIGEILRFSGVELLALNTEVTVGRSKLEHLISLLANFKGREWNKGADTGLGGDQRHELGVKKLNGIGFTRKEGVDDFLRDFKSLFGAGVLSTVIDSTDGVFTTLEIYSSLLSDKDHVNINSLCLKFLKTSLSLLDHEGVVTSAQTTVTGDTDKGDFVDLTDSEKGEVSSFSTETGDESTEDRLKGLREGTGGEHRVLGTTHLSGGDELHGTGDLFGVVDSGDTVTDS